MDNRFLFRGIDQYSKAWVYGDLCSFGEFPLIFTGVDIDHVVDFATIGQCTGLSAAKSYRGNKPEDLLIFEGDIVRVLYFDGGYQHCDERSVTWNANVCGFMPMGWEKVCESCDMTTEIESIEIIGTVFDDQKGGEE